MANENKCRIEEVEKQLQIFEAKISDLADQNTAAIKNFEQAQKIHDKSQKEMFKGLTRIMGEGQAKERENGEKLDLIENEIRILLVNSVMDQLDR